MWREVAFTGDAVFGADDGLDIAPALLSDDNDQARRSMSALWGGTLCTTCPSTAHQFALDLGAGMPARWTSEPPGFQLHRWKPQTGLVTHTGLIGAFEVRPLRH